MFRNPQISWKALSDFASSMSRMQEAGVEIRKALKSASRNSRDGRLTTAVDSAVQQVSSGATLTEAIEAQGDLFPPLFRDLVNVGEHTGHTPEVFAALSRYYEARLRQLSNFRNAIAWPAVQLAAAILIIGLLIFILGILPTPESGEPFDVLGIGLIGARGATIWLLGWAGVLGAAFFLWRWSTHSAAGQMALHPILMNLPVVGHCMSAFAISRFSWCFALTQQAGMSIRPSLGCSLKATANGAFINAEPYIWHALEQGESMADALRVSRLFPTQFLHFVETAEHTGTVPEQLDRMSHAFEEDALRALDRINRVAATLVWLCVAGFIIAVIFRLFIVFYLNPINETLRGI